MELLNFSQDMVTEELLLLECEVISFLELLSKNFCNLAIHWTTDISSVAG